LDETEYGTNVFDSSDLYRPWYCHYGLVEEQGTQGMTQVVQIVFVPSSGLPHQFSRPPKIRLKSLRIKILCPIFATINKDLQKHRRRKASKGHEPKKPQKENVSLRPARLFLHDYSTTAHTYISYAHPAHSYRLPPLRRL
jgi:hypothetical protein